MSNQNDHSVRDEVTKNHSVLGSFLANIIVVAGIASIVSVGTVMLNQPKDKASTGFVLVNTDSLVREEIEILGEKVRKGEIPSSDMPMKSKAFSAALLEELNKYTQMGYIVLRGEAVIAAPSDVQDITISIKERLQANGLMEKQSLTSNK